jgi:hypothetical protein
MAQRATNVRGIISRDAGPLIVAREDIHVAFVLQGVGVPVLVLAVPQVGAVEQDGLEPRISGSSNETQLFDVMVQLHLVHVVPRGSAA